MTEKTPLKKRIKRRVTARTHRFFAVCSPGVKRLCHKEIVALTQGKEPIASHMEDEPLLHGHHDGGLLRLKFEDIAIIPGGVEFTGTVKECYCANLYLRSASRILMRIAKFKAENFRTLEKKLGEIEWELYLQPSVPIRYEVSTGSSRLYHKDAIAQRAEETIEAYFHNQQISSPQIGGVQEPDGMQTVMIRGQDDLFEISIDSSGDLLHKRGLKEYVGAAPIRETLGFAILSAMEYSPDLPLIDGMCGSGTFALEAAMISGNIPAGLFRKFAFEKWPCFSAAQWNHIKRSAESDIKSPDRDPLIFAVDQDRTILELLNRTVEKFNLSRSIKIIKGDFFDLVPEELTDKSKNMADKRNYMPAYRGDMADEIGGMTEKRGYVADKRGFVVLNPPYGKRIKERSGIDQIFADIGIKLKSDFRGWCAAVIVPDKRYLDHLPGKKTLIPIFHGGLEIHVAIIRL